MWDTYSCDKCDNFKLLSVLANHSDSRSAFLSWCGSMPQCAAVSKDEGGKALTDACGNGGWGGTKFFIKPDKSFKEYSSSDLSANGIVKHVCGTGINTNSRIADNVIKFKKTQEAMLVYIPFSRSCIVEITDIRGKKLSSFTTSGTQQWYSMPKSISSGMHIISVKNGSKTFVKKFSVIK